jgi:hypothetical protein
MKNTVAIILASLLGLLVPASVSAKKAPHRPTHTHCALRHARRHASRHCQAQIGGSQAQARITRRRNYKSPSGSGSTGTTTGGTTTTTGGGTTTTTGGGTTTTTGGGTTTTPGETTTTTGETTATTVFPIGSSSTQCSLFASPGGSDSTGTGSLASPFRSVVRLDSALAAGQTGCLLEGTYGSTSTEHKLTKSGASTGQVTITSYPGQTATVVGWIDVEGAYTTLSHLRIDGSNTFYTTERANTTCPYPVSQGLVLAGASDVLEYNDYYQSVSSLRGNGIGIGWWGAPDNAVVRFNKIHDTGQCDQYDHSIYLAHGNNVQVYDNWLWNNHGGQSFSIYPGATNARIYANVLDSSDSGFTMGDNGSSYVSGAAVYHNVVSNMKTLINLDTGLSMSGVLISCNFISTASTGNQAYTDDSYNNLGGASTGCSSTAHISLSGITTANPQYVDPANHDYAVQSSSPLAGWELWNGN